MPPKKREKEAEASKGVVRMDHLQADHELFLQAFEKPTQIYRFLRTRNMLKPIYLNRTLSYMRQRMSRSHKSRNGFKVDSILDKVIQKNRNELQAHCLGDFMTLAFLGIYDNNLNGNEENLIRVEALILKLCYKKRKDISTPGDEIPVGSCSVPLNPSECPLPPTAPAISISSETFSPSQGPEVKSYVLRLKASLSPRINNQIRSADDSDSEPSFKRSKTVDTTYHKVLGCEMVVYDRHNRCQLKSGEYELVLRETTPQVRSPHKVYPTHWETLSQENIEVMGESNPFDVFKLKPTLKLRLTWSHEATNGVVNRPKPIPNGDSNTTQGGAENNKTDNNNHCNKENNKPSSNCSRLNNMFSKGSDVTVAKSQANGTEKSENTNSLQIIYQFLYNNNSRQQTEACEDLHCPWCSLDCGRLYSLLKHLKLCHSRFNFTYYPIPNGARIDVSINESYDGSYAGSPHWAAMSGGVRGGSGPGRRAPLTQTLVCHPLRRHSQLFNNLAEFRETEDNDITMDGQRPFITGHNRLYHHTITCLPVNPKELEVDSEGETDPLWLQQKTMMMIDEFTDVNEGEKELMKMWNLHVMKYNFVGDCQIPLACQMFVQTRGKELLEKNLYRNFVLHMCSLHDFGLITPVVVYQTIQMLNQILAENNDVKVKIRKNIIIQREHWKSFGMHQQPLEPKSTQQSKPSFSGFNGESSPAVRRKTSNINYTQHPSSSSGSEAKKKAEMSHSAVVNIHPSTNNTSDKDSKKSSTCSNIGSSKNASSSTILSPQVLLRRKSLGSQGSNSSNRKRLSLQDRKNST